MIRIPSLRLVVGAPVEQHRVSLADNSSRWGRCGGTVPNLADFLRGPTDASPLPQALRTLAATRTEDHGVFDEIDIDDLHKSQRGWLTHHVVEHPQRFLCLTAESRRLLVAGLSWQEAKIFLLNQIDADEDIPVETLADYLERLGYTRDGLKPWLKVWTQTEAQDIKQKINGADFKIPAKDWKMCLELWDERLGEVQLELSKLTAESPPGKQRKLAQQQSELAFLVGFAERKLEEIQSGTIALLTNLQQQLSQNALETVRQVAITRLQIAWFDAHQEAFLDSVLHEVAISRPRSVLASTRGRHFGVLTREDRIYGQSLSRWLTGGDKSNVIDLNSRRPG